MTRSVWKGPFVDGYLLKKADAPEYNKVGRINGNTILHIANTNEAGMERITPMVWSRVYGGCAYGVVDGNTLVHIEGGMLGNNIFALVVPYSVDSLFCCWVFDGSETTSSAEDMVMWRLPTRILPTKRCSERKTTTTRLLTPTSSVTPRYRLTVEHGYGTARRTPTEA